MCNCGKSTSLFKSERDRISLSVVKKRFRTGIYTFGDTQLNTDVQRTDGLRRQNVKATIKPAGISRHEGVKLFSTRLSWGLSERTGCLVYASQAAPFDRARFRALACGDLRILKF